MKVFVPASHTLHRPKIDLSDGLPGVPHPEQPNRVDHVLQGIRKAGAVDVERVEGQAEAAVRALHDGDYVDFLEDLADSLESGGEVVPSIFRGDLSTAPLALRTGMYCREIGTPISRYSIQSAHNSAATALAAAQHILSGRGSTFALCRPPGHHAGKRRYGGYCYFNNAYVAARALAEDKRRCPVLDIDYHLGDGSLEFAGAATPYLSLHADAQHSYPYTPAASGEHITLLDLPAHTGTDQYLDALNQLVASTNALSPDAIVVSVGFDTVADDDVQDQPLNIQVTDFVRIGQAVACLNGPLCLILEGGYDARALAECAEAFISGLRAGPS